MIYENVALIFLSFSLNNPEQKLLYADTGPEPFQVLITEIMADPSPAVGLPEYEYIEIYNRGSKDVSLLGFNLSIGSYTVIVPECTLRPQSYAVICDHSASDEFRNYGMTIPVDVFPPVLNTGQVITLSFNQKVIHTVTFLPDWYNDPDKSDGGWSLEMIDTENPCGGWNNWRSSKDPSGGTPAQRNSVANANPDFEQPIMVRAILPSDSTVEVIFNEPMIFHTVAVKNNYTVSHNLFQPDSVFCSGPDCSKILLHYRQKFREGLIYTVSLLDEPKDCAGNKIAGNTSVGFGIPEKVSTTDIVFNEILFEPLEDDEEFIELYNKSDKVLDLADLSLCLSNSETGSSEKAISLAKMPYLLLPHNYVALTRNIYPVLKFHPEARIRNLLQVPLFALSNEEGILVLKDAEEIITDEFHYNSTLHHPWLNETKGVSLERINPEVPSSDPDNWESASSSGSYATPGYVNSQRISERNEIEITLSNEYLSPDNDGLDDDIVLNLRLPEPGWMGSVMIYSMNGVRIRNLLSNCLLSNDEFILWDGKSNEGKIAEMGLYIIFGEVFNTKGSVKNFKKVISLVKK